MPPGMNAVPPFFRSSDARDTADAASLRWEALVQASTVVAMLARIEPERPSPQIRNFPALIPRMEEWRRKAAENGIADLAAVMEPGIAALLALNARCADPQPAATALWQEYRAARDAIVALLPLSDRYASA